MADAPERVTGEVSTGAGTLRATIVPGDARNQIRSVSFSGVPTQPEGVLAGLEQALAGSSIDGAATKISEFFTQNPGAVPGVTPDEFLTALSLACMKVRLSTSTAPDPSAWKKEGGA